MDRSVENIQSIFGEAGKYAFLFLFSSVLSLALEEALIIEFSFVSSSV